MIFSSTFVGKYSFGHYDLNLPQSQPFAGRYINKPLQIDFRSDQLQATNQETYFMMRIMLSLMAGKH